MIIYDHVDMKVKKSKRKEKKEKERFFFVVCGSGRSAIGDTSFSWRRGTSGRVTLVSLM